ncbi:hypothetical protein BHE74_00003881 [Ensete ventricosum]|nr:hypothetical protein GW17_00008568 [Ensete ventricosum]RWW87299.1 hypothetical protein BHE74_00003881 [Ensete ventricosum]RZR80261.1 hypothetical protein BHM03_00006243 [Ensete ventricosum]
MSPSSTPSSTTRASSPHWPTWSRLLRAELISSPSRTGWTWKTPAPAATTGS